MGLERERPSGFGNIQEQLGPLPQKRGIFRGEIMLPNVQEQLRLGEARVKLSQEQREKALQEALNQLRKNQDFESFTDPSENGENSFVNRYDGNFCQDMELNRKAVERVLNIVHLDGQVFLTSRSSAPKNSKEESSLYKVKSVPQGWSIEINDRKIT